MDDEGFDRRRAHLKIENSISSMKLYLLKIN